MMPDNPDDTPKRRLSKPNKCKCGGEVSWHEDDKYVWFMCHGCWEVSAQCETQSEVERAIIKWNREPDAK